MSDQVAESLFSNLQMVSSILQLAIPYLRNAAYLVGVFYLVSWTLSLTKTILRNTSFWGFNYSKSKNNWAVISGASDGIGKEFALQLAKKGYNVILLARTESKLLKVAEECKSFGVKTEIVQFDFSCKDGLQYTQKIAKFAELPVEILVNNVGLSHEFPVSVVEEEWNRIEDILAINVDSMIRMCRLFIPGMVERKKGLVLNIGSMAGKVPSGLLAVYGGSKAFVRSFSQGLAMEVQSKGVHVEHVNTYFVQTAMSKIRKSSLLVPTPKQFVQSVLHSAGTSISSTPYFSHALLDWILDTFVPEKFQIKKSFMMHVDIRKRALRKLERESKKQ